MPRSHSMSLCWCSGCDAASRIVGFDPVERRLGVHAVGHERAARQRVLCEQRPVQLEAALIGIGVDDAGDADRVVVGQQSRATGRGGRRQSARTRLTRTGCSARSCAGCPSAGRSRRARRGRARRRALGTSRRCRSSTGPVSSARRPARCGRRPDGRAPPCRARRGSDSAARGGA